MEDTLCAMMIFVVFRNFFSWNALRINASVFTHRTCISSRSLVSLITLNNLVSVHQKHCFNSVMICVLSSRNLHKPVCLLIYTFSELLHRILHLRPTDIIKLSLNNTFFWSTMWIPGLCF